MGRFSKGFVFRGQVWGLYYAFTLLLYVWSFYFTLHGFVRAWWLLEGGGMWSVGGLVTKGMARSVCLVESTLVFDPCSFKPPSAN